MPVTFVLNPEQVEFLTQHQEDMSLVAQAEMLGCHVDTLKRLLVRHNIRDFTGSKYIAAEPINTWSRPCTVCKDTKPRPKWQYRCDECHSKQQRDDDP